MAQKIILQAKAYIICDQRRVRIDGTAPIRLIVKYQTKQKVWGLGEYLTNADYKLTKRKFLGGNISETKKKEIVRVKNTITDNILKAKQIINDLPVFTFEAFEKRMFGANRNSLFEALEIKIQEMIDEGRAGNATTYQCTLNAIRLFREGERVTNGRNVSVIGGKDITLREVDVYFLKEFERWFLEKGNSKTTVGIYIRNIRVILNDAIRDGELEAKYLPFGKTKYTIPSSTKRKLALTIQGVGKIQFTELLSRSTSEKYRDYWLFSYYTGGMNVKDISRLRYRNLVSGEISYVRAKTALKKRESEETINIPLWSVAETIIDRWGNKPTLPDSYIFPILKPGMTPMEERKAVVNTTAAMNKHIKKIAANLGIEGRISSYTARHSFATILKNSGVSVQAISEALGHSDTKVTQNYLADFETSEKRKQWENLVPQNENGTS